MRPLCIAPILVLALLSAAAKDNKVPTSMMTKQAVRHDISLPLVDYPTPAYLKKVKAVDVPVRHLPTPAEARSVSDTVVQSTAAAATSVIVGPSFDGIAYSGRIPPDPNIAVGGSYILQGVNIVFAVFNKSGGFLTTLFPWFGFGGACETNPGGDPIVQYDRLADRWVIAQFANPNGPTYYFCIAVSTTSNPMGSYARYAYTFSRLPDYPKVGVWPSAYFASFNMFSGNNFAGPQVCAYDRSKMLAGQPAIAVCYQLSTSYFSLLPSDLDGTTAPSTNYYISDTPTGNVLLLWKFSPNFANPSASQFIGPTTIAVASFSRPCASCVPQSGTTQKLDTLGDRLMYRAAYRNLGTYDALVVNRSVSSGTSIGIRWFEIRNLASTPIIYNQGTYAPDSRYRWMGSAAMDRTGNIAVGYSLSSSAMHPAIALAGRSGLDAPNVLGPESVMFQGGGSQLPQTCVDGSACGKRWGDYTSLRVDPIDDSTFWYVNEYHAANDTQWLTRIGSLTIPPAPYLCSATPVCTGSGNVVIANVTLGCSQATQISTTATACGTSCSTANGPSGVLTSSSAGTVAPANGSGSCTLQWTYNGHTYSKTLQP